MAGVAHMINVFAVFVPSDTVCCARVTRAARELNDQSGIGSHGEPLPGAAFGLYRPESELRAVYATHHHRARRACTYWRERGERGHKAGCDQPILLGERSGLIV